MKEEAHAPTSVGETVRKLLGDRGWTQSDLAEVLEIPPSRVTELIQGRKVVDPALAVALAGAFPEISPRDWLSIDADFRLSQIPQDGDVVRRRAKLLELAPTKDMERRGWIPKTSSAAELEQALCQFFGVPDLEEIPELDASTRKSNDPADSLTPSQRAWCFFVRTRAEKLIVAPFDPASLDECIARLQKLTAFAPEVRKISQTLAEFGIRFLIVEPLPGSKIDGVAMWVGGAPVIAVSLRLDRIDYFWFTVFHELAHIRNKDGLSVDLDLVGKDATLTAMKSDIERRADNDAAEMMIPPEKIQSFIHRVAPLYSKERIVQFAHRNKVHPGIVVGQLQHRGQIGFHANREMLVPVRDIAIATSVVDGWGHIIS